MGLGRYIAIFRAPGAAPLIVAAVIGRLPYGMNVLALILLMRAEGYGYGAVGLASGASGLAVGGAVAILSRLVDRVGQTRVLATTAVLVLACAGLLAAAVLAHAPLGVVTALAALAGASTPPVSPCMRALWPRLVGRERLDTAYAFDALTLELAFIVGPLLTAGLADGVSPLAALLTGATLQSAGALLFAAAAASRAWRPDAEAAGRRLHALAVPGMRTLVAALVLSSVALGALEIGVVAFADQESQRSSAGVLFTLWAVGSLTGGLWYGARTWRSPAYRRFLAVFAALTVGVLPLPLAGSMPALGALLVLAGLALAPLSAAGYSLVADLAAVGALTESYAWQIVGSVVGASLGAWVAGVLADASGPAAALALAPASCAAGLAIALAGRRSLGAGLLAAGRPG